MSTPGPRTAQPPHPDGERLSKRMTALGLASRREADEWIEAGWVKVNGQMAVLGQRVQPDARIEVDPAARQQQAKRVTVLLHKPIGTGASPSSSSVRTPWWRRNTWCA